MKITRDIYAKVKRAIRRANVMYINNHFFVNIYKGGVVKVSRGCWRNSKYCIRVNEFGGTYREFKLHNPELFLKEVYA